MSNACKGLAGLIFGHKYQARYNSGMPALTSVNAADGSPDDWIDLVETSKPTTYVHDVCARCGDIAGGAK